MTGNITLSQNTSVIFNAALSNSQAYTGICMTGPVGSSASVTFGQMLVWDAASSSWVQGDISAAVGATGDCRGVIGICVSAAASSGTTKVLIYGTVRYDSFPTLTVNAPVYASTAGAVVVAQTSTTDYVIRVLGAALTTHEMLFNPSEDYITHT